MLFHCVPFAKGAENGPFISLGRAIRAEGNRPLRPGVACLGTTILSLKNSFYGND
jgi:hypothetical protein